MTTPINETLIVGSGIVIAESASSSTITISTNALSGTYTPSLSNTTNIDSSVPYISMYSQIGNMVSVNGQFVTDPTYSGSSTFLGISLPVALTSAFAFSYQCAGGACDSVGQVGRIYGDTVNNNRAILQFVSNRSSTSTWDFWLMYLVV